MGREWMETSEVKHNHPLDTDPGGIWDNGKRRAREKQTACYYTQKCWQSLQWLRYLKLRTFQSRSALTVHRVLLFMTLSYFSVPVQ